MSEQPLDAASIEVVAGSPTEEEMAAVTAVVQALAEEHDALQRRESGPARNGWERSRRALRGTPSSSDTVWRGFGG
ncbi:acyl-CoA carboxylase subunit epsilon [Desertivibrio insolitus]|uniref:acyl-CoA carboxylase subunit epsilon n=1 Tax=Herbiconiux sp. SYSU D00978 TaxID=2812562 RepID=UPI0027DD4B97|nr:acyl-CoA carboxylase subunit epsilon [Herbiconiux sp. SYSU D00978]